MKMVSSEAMRGIDRGSIEDHGMAGAILMDRAGKGVADAVEDLALHAIDGFAAIRMVAGHGNNGGDVFVAARYLAKRGFDVEVLLACKTEALKGDAAYHFGLMADDEIVARELPDEKDWEDCCDVSCDIVVDGVLGTGTKGAARGVAAAAIRHINSLSDACLIVAVDIPSGLNADTGEVAGDVVMADMTVTIALPKVGFVSPSALDFVGHVRVVDIGVPDDLVENVESDVDLVVLQDLKTILCRRKSDSHKGTYGHVLVIGGAPGYVGAAALAGRAALRSGAGLVSLLVPESVVSGIIAGAPELMVHGAKATEQGSLSADSLDAWQRDIEEFDSVLIGPGLTTHEAGRALLEKVLKQSKVPVVVDADALNLCEGDLSVLASAECPIVITPHPGEMARLSNRSVEDVQSDRVGVAQEVAQSTGAAVILKGAGTVIVSNEGPVSINLTGNPGMASGGTGDVLAGMVVSFLAQGLGLFDACRSSVYLHGVAGDRAAWRLSQSGMIAGDLIDELPRVVRDVVGR